MCLEIRSRNPDSLNKKFVNGKVTFYKVVNKCGNKLYTPFQSFLVNSGFFKAVRPLDKDNISHLSSVWGGAIHVYTNKKAALASVDNLYNNGIELVIPVTCYKKDFLAVGNNEDACFTKVFIRKKDYEKALKSKSKYAVVGK